MPALASPFGEGGGGFEADVTFVQWEEGLSIRRDGPSSRGPMVLAGYGKRGANRKPHRVSIMISIQ